MTVEFNYNGVSQLRSERPEFAGDGGEFPFRVRGAG